MRKNLIYALIIAIFIMGSYSITRYGLADYHYRKALEIEGGTKWTRTVASYQKAIDLDPSNAEYHNKLAQLYLRRARHQSTADNSQFTIHHSRLDFLNLSMHSYKKAINLCPKNGNYWLGLGMVCEQLVKLNPRRRTKLKGSAQSPSTYNLEPSTYNLPPTTYYLLAADCYQTALSLDPNNSFYRTILGSFYIRNGRRKEGLKEYEKAVASLPKIHLYDFLKGKDVRDEFLDVAINGLKKAIELYPKDVNIYHQLGSIYIKKGMYAEAIEQYQHALKLKPEHRGFKRTLESLKNQSKKANPVSYEP